ncbi:DEAD/DEAH box helicase family protein [Algiphilus sp. W345]|uniref:DEAD/DEAH box helicase family protein n=1 Tax=Banduia mediterranea TaxID=3075609 RepID=A0ABU2WMW1_9GAMM|nr:DEAD/DEAH box helicase family protein [Algiphilus sp. W345]MDT0499222.1 DEAD/DEAH box helicase family protein [Algiphilus sp. W345]
MIDNDTWQRAVPSVSVTYARNGVSTRANALGMRPMQERAYNKRGEQYLLIKSPPASGKSRALMFVALDKLKNQGLKQATIVVPEKSIGASFNDEPLWHLAVIASRTHLVWIATVCGKLKTDFRYSNTLGWNTFPVPTLTEKNKADLTRCAEGILLARERHFPDTIADLYDPENMAADLRAAHDRNDEALECIDIGRRFRNDTERLEKLFDLYIKMTAAAVPRVKSGGRKR